MQGFKNKVIWITGASGGIGEALAYEFAKYEALLVLSARRLDELNRVKRNCKLPDNNVMVLPLDLEETSQANEMVKDIIARFGRIDILINNGGISQRAEAIDTPLSLDRKLMEVNYFGAVALTKAALPYLIKNKTGHLVVVSSIAGKFGFYWRSAYSAAKFALHGFFESLRLELHDHNINVTIVCPGKIKTNVSLNAITDKGSKHNQMDPSHEHAMSAEECAKQIVNAIYKNKKEVLIGRTEILTVYIKRFFPNLFYHIIRRVKPV